jgi:hypothetical protein
MEDQSPFQDAVPISDQDDSLLRRMNEFDGGSLQTQESLPPKEIQTSLFGASIQLYNSGCYGRDYDGQIQAVKEAATILSVILNVDVIGGIFEEIVAEHHHPYDVFARAQSEIDRTFNSEPK